MQHISGLINKKIVPATSQRKINVKWERAQEFGKYVGIPTLVVLRLFRMYGEKKVLSLRSWLYDIPHDNRKGGKIALAHWKLKST